MKQFSLAGLFSLAGVCAVWAAASPIYVNDVIVQPPATPPQIDATAFLNNSIFDVTGTQLPFQTQNTRHFTNSASGQMIGSPGFIFQYFTTTGSLNYAAYNFINHGRISVSTAFGSQSSLFVNSTNVLNSQSLAGDGSTDIRILGTNVSIAGSGLRASSSTTPFPFFGGFQNLGGVTGLYWGAGTNNALGTNRPMRLDGFGFLSGNLDLPSPSSPFHQVLQPGFFGGIATNVVSVPSFSGGSTFGAFVHTNRTGPTSSVVQIVFVATNSPSNPNLAVNVRFATPFFGFGQGTDAIVEFGNVSYDIVDESLTTNLVYLVDSSVNAAQINLFPTNFNPKIPSTYSVMRSTPFEWETAESANLAYTNNLIFSPQHGTNQVDNLYAAYSARIGQTNSLAAAGGSLNPILSDPTNFHGKVEIFSDQLNLFDTRIKAENFIGIQTRNLKDNLFAQVDAPFVNFDVGSTNVDLTISNIAPATVSRLFGTISAWTGVWNNNVLNPGVPGGVDNVRFHVLIVDNALQGELPVTLHKFAARCTNLTIVDNLRISSTMLLNAPAVTVRAGGGLTLPGGSSWGATNVVKLNHFTNSGVINIPQLAGFGTATNGTPLSYSNFVNHGSITSTVFKAYSRYFESSGLGTLSTPGSITSIGGVVFVDTLNGFLSNGLMASYSGTMTLNASNLNVRGTTLQSGTIPNGAGQFIRGPMVIAVTNSFNDGSPGATNNWLTTFGIQVLRRPTSGSLTNTIIRSVADAHATPSHIWPAQDRGPYKAGYSNNLAVGKLVLDGTVNSTFIFGGLTAGNAIYVDYLELKNGATNYNTQLNIASDFTIYFADCNIPPDKLDGAKNGRLRWVRNYIGAFSSTNITYPSGRTYTFNAGLVRSTDIDSDGDGPVNSIDPTPIYTDEDIGLTIASVNVPPLNVAITWKALFSSTNILEYNTNVNGLNWMTLTSFLTGPVNVTARVLDGIPDRFYRVRVLMP